MANQKQSLSSMAREACQLSGYDPIKEMVRLAQRPDASDQTKLSIATALLPYIYPRLSQVEVDARVETSDSQLDQKQELLRRVMMNPELADAAQRLSIAAAESAVDLERNGNGEYEPVGVENPGLRRNPSLADVVKLDESEFLN